MKVAGKSIHLKYSDYQQPEYLGSISNLDVNLKNI